MRKWRTLFRNKVDVQPGIKERKSMKEQSTKAVAKKKFFKMVFSRAGIFVILILVQMLIFLGIPYYLKEYATFIYSVMSLMEIIVLVYIINTEGNPAFKLSWILCVMAVPAVGTIFYIYVHLQLETRFVQNRLAALRMETEPYMDQDQKITDALWEENLQMHSCRIICRINWDFRLTGIPKPNIFRLEKPNSHP